MATRPLGSSGIMINPLVLGGNVFGWTATGSEAYRILDSFVAAGSGGAMIDTADAYMAHLPGMSGGESEALIGDWLKRRGRRNDVLISTKVGLLPGVGGKGLSPSRIRHACDESLTRLGTDHIDLYFAHVDDPYVPQLDVAEAFDGLVTAGKVRALGASQFSPERIESAIAVCDQAGLTGYTVVQPEYNLVSRAAFEGPLRSLCRERDLGVIPYFALAAGFLTGKYRSSADLEGAARGPRVSQYLTAEGLRALEVMDEITSETGATHSQIALAWLAAQPGVTAPIASATSLAQVEELLGSFHVRLSEAQMAALNEVAPTDGPEVGDRAKSVRESGDEPSSDVQSDPQSLGRVEDE